MFAELSPRLKNPTAASPFFSGRAQSVEPDAVHTVPFTAPAVLNALRSQELVGE